MTEVTEFEKAKQRYQKRYGKHVRKEDLPVKSPPKSGIHVVVTDNDRTYTFDFNIPTLAGNRSASLRTKEAYERTIRDFVKKEFGKWQSLQTV